MSATIDPDGTVTASTGQFTAGVLVDRTVLRDTTTMATRLRSVPEWVLAAMGLTAIAAAAVVRRREGGTPRAREDEDG